MTTTEKCEPHGFTDCCNVLKEVIEASECLDLHMGNCDGAPEYRYPLSGTGRSFVRCDRHWSERLDIQQGINRRYPDSSFAPSDFDPTYAGESWNDDY